MDMFYALSEPKRRTIIEMLASQGQLSASTIAEQFQISKAAISQHLKILRQTKLVLMEKRAQQRIYRLNPDAFQELEQWAKQTTELWNARFDRLDEVLKLQMSKTKGGGDGR